jgi:CRP-like cAMP-binding protein
MGDPLLLYLETFVKLSNEDRAWITRATSRSIRDVAARRDIVREGEKPVAMNVVLEGWACRYKQLPDGRRQIVSFFIPGDFCDTNIFILKAMDHSIAAVTNVRLAQIAPVDFELLMNRSLRLAAALWWHELVTVSIQREWTTNVGQRTAAERIAHLFCETFVRLRVVDMVDGNSCDWPLTQYDLAEATGLTAVHVNRTLQDFRRQGLIELQGRRLLIPDLDRLMTAGMFNPGYLHLDHEGNHLNARN